MANQFSSPISQNTSIKNVMSADRSLNPPASKHALFIAYHYPPESSSSGVLRTLKYSRYLQRFGWRVTVITLNRNAYEVVDPGLENQIPAEVRVLRTRFVDIKKNLALRGRYPAFLAIPDRWIGWWPWGVAAGRRVLARDQVNVIYSTSPHPTAHLIALALARRKRIPWVADFRDPWYEEPPEPGTTRLGHFAARRLESVVVKHADRVVASTQRLRDVLAARYQSERDEKFVAISNGYDEADFTNVGEVSPVAGEFSIVHAGVLSDTFRDPRPVFEAIGQAAATGGIDLSRLRLRFLGAGPFGRSLEEAIHGTVLEPRVEFLPRVSYETSLAEISRASILLLLQASKDTVDLIPAKLFEYLRVGRPVLALVPSGATAEVLRRTGGGWIVDPSDADGLRDTLISAYQAWATDRLDSWIVDQSKLEQFRRERLAETLAQEFDSVAKQQ
jgi:glycosyltransferase involved in cell wall biosynthesis